MPSGSTVTLVDTNVLLYRQSVSAEATATNSITAWWVLLSEDFQHDRLYGTVRAAVNPFLEQ